MSEELEVGDKVRFVDVHHAMNSDLKSHEGDKGIVRTLDHGYQNKVLVEFIEGSTKKVGDRWAIDPNRLEPVQSSVSKSNTEGDSN